MTRQSESWRDWPLPEPGTSLTKWQAGRCAWCGVTGRPLVEDHCHRTGLVRGLLCRSCNTAEGQSTTPAWREWRSGDCPARTIGHFEVYVSIFGQTRLHPSAALSYYSEAEREEWWEALPSWLAAGGEWPTEAPWTDVAVERRERDRRSLREAIARLGTGAA